MGKAVPRALKIRAEFLLKQFPKKFGKDFEKNKEVINELNLPLSKVNRNIVAGFISRKLATA